MVVRLDILAVSDADDMARAEAELGRRSEAANQVIRDLVEAASEPLRDAPDGCNFGYSDQWDALGAAMASPKYEECRAQEKIAWEAIPEVWREMDAGKTLRILEMLEDGSFELDDETLYTLLGRRLQEDLYQLEHWGELALASLCGLVE